MNLSFKTIFFYFNLLYQSNIMHDNVVKKGNLSNTRKDGIIIQGKRYFIKVNSYIEKFETKSNLRTQLLIMIPFFK